MILKKIFKIKNLRTVLIIFIIFSVCYFLIPLKNPLFKDSYSTVIKDKNGMLLGAYISKDEQWRFPPVKKIPDKFKKCIINFEDRFFYYHFGINPVSVFRAVYLNFKNKKITSGASTISMQVVRLYRKGKKRTYYEKIIELIYTLKLETLYSKNDILSLYVSHAPYGGNVVGLEAASWRYFGRNIDNLSWAENALIAVLPNAPAIIHPGKNTQILKEKRDRLLFKLYKRKIISFDDYQLSIEEQLPDNPHDIPQYAPHLLLRAVKDGYNEKNITTTIDLNYQLRSLEIIDKHYKYFKQSKINNAACIIVKVDTGEVLSYVGNTNSDNDFSNGNSVDIIDSLRSPGSLLKPFLYAFLLEEGLLSPEEIVPDIPIIYSGFSPKNYNKTYDGAVFADDALKRSLNVPFVYLLREYGYQKFYHRLEQLGMKFYKKPSDYSLTLILGAAESSLWDLTSMYASLARVLKNYNINKKPFPYSNDDYFKHIYIKNNFIKEKKFQKNGLLSAGVIYRTFSAMNEVSRPSEDINWEQFSSTQPIAWKTGTSYGNRDALAIGITKDYVIGVWVGNADGEGRPEIRGTNVAAPVLFDLFNILPKSEWFNKPDDLISIKICKKSGMSASPICEPVDYIEIPKTCLKRTGCFYHKIIHLDENEKYQVDSSVYPVSKMTHKNWFILPPLQEWYYKKKNNGYLTPPPLLKSDNQKIMDLIYPDKKSVIFVPIELDGKPGKAVFELAHRDQYAVVYWHIDGNYVGETTYLHQIAVYPEVGKHELVVIDNKGNQIIQAFEVISRSKKIKK